MADRILVVDDDESLQELCAATFRMAGWEVEVADSGDRAVKMLDGAAYDAVLTDLHMPGKLDGQGVVRAVKARFPETEVVIMTAVPTLKTAIATLKDGAADYVVKPFETEHLSLVVRRAVDARRLRRELDRERAMRQELANAYAELQKVEEMKESFLARISHELRTPLGEVLTAVELMERAAGGSGDPNKLKRYLELSKAGAGKLDRVISDLLAFVELQQRPALSKSPVDLARLCRDTVDRLRPLWEPRGLSVETAFDAMPAVSGDPGLLARAFEHLIQNAVTFNRDKGKIVLAGHAKDGSAFVSVSDTGDGIPPEEFERVFDSFYQIANYLTRKVGGLGLGLAITRRIVEAHRGHIDVQSKVGEGTTFRVRLPVAG